MDNSRTKAWKKFKTTNLYKKIIDPKNFLKHPSEDYPYAKGLRNRIKDAWYKGYDARGK